MTIPGEIGQNEAGMRRRIARMRANKPINGRIILDCNAETINKFCDEGIASGRITQTSSVMSWMDRLRAVDLWISKPFLEMTKEDYVDFFANRVKAGSRSSYARIIRGFCNWLYDLPNKTYPPCIDWIGAPPQIGSKIMPKDILNAEEIKAILRACDTQDKARFGIHIESGARNNEVHFIQKSDLESTMFMGRFGYRLTLYSNPLSRTKAGAGSFRVVPIVIMAPYVTDWINMHPNWNSQPDPYLWCNSYCKKKLGNERTWYRKIKRIVARSGVTKNVYPDLATT